MHLFPSVTNIWHIFFICSPGRVIVDLVLQFNQSVSVTNVIHALKTAAKERKFGSFIVDPSSIEQTPSSSTSPMPTGYTQGTLLKGVVYCL